MSLETQLYTALKGLVSNRVYRDIAPANVTTLPRITFQQVGGDAINFMSGDKPSKKLARVQVNCWDDRRDDVMALARLVEDTLRATLTLGTTVLGAAIAVYEPDTKLFGSMQDFSVSYDD
jgi:uncharacterized protein DUF3168